jgi:hypothetical protein
MRSTTEKSGIARGGVEIVTPPEEYKMKAATL